jgi:hypothetical protein
MRVALIEFALFDQTIAPETPLDSVHLRPRFHTCFKRLVKNGYANSDHQFASDYNKQRDDILCNMSR